MSDLSNIVLKRATELSNEHAGQKECTCGTDDYSCPYRDVHHDFVRGYFAGMKDPIIRDLLKALEFYGNKENWKFTSSLPHPLLGMNRMTISDFDKELGLVCNGESDNVGGRTARELLAKWKELTGETP